MNEFLSGRDMKGSVKMSNMDAHLQRARPAALTKPQKAFPDHASIGSDIPP